MADYENTEEMNVSGFEETLKSLVRNEICITTDDAYRADTVTKSRIGGKPAVPADFEWPRFEAEDHNGQTANRPLSFLCQINLEEVAPFDKEALLPQKGLLLFFYELVTQRWGYEPSDRGCARVFYFEDTENLELMEYPDDLQEDFFAYFTKIRLQERHLSFNAADSYPGIAEFKIHTGISCDWEAFYNFLEEKINYDTSPDRHKLLGYADDIQNEMLTECERVTRGTDLGNSESARCSSAEEKADIDRAKKEWILLFQMSSFRLVNFGDDGDIYFYIRKEDLKAKRFDNVWLVLQCY